MESNNLQKCLPAEELHKPDLQLFKAVDDGNLDQVNRLIKEGADVNAVASEQIFPLLLLSLDANAEMVK